MSTGPEAHIPPLPLDDVWCDMDLANLAAKKLGATVKLVDIDFASTTSGAAFAAKKCDRAMGAITITDQRKQTISVCKPYFSATQALLVKKSSGIGDLSSQASVTSSSPFP